MHRQVLGAALVAALMLSVVPRMTAASRTSGQTGSGSKSPIPGTAYAGQIPVTVNGKQVGYANIYQPTGSDGKPKAGGAYSGVDANSDLGRELQKAGARPVNGQIVLEKAGPNVGRQWTARPGSAPGSNEYWRDAQVDNAKGGGSIDVWYNLLPPPPPPPPAPEPKPTGPKCGPGELNWFGKCISLAKQQPSAPSPPRTPQQEQPVISPPPAGNQIPAAAQQPDNPAPEPADNTSPPPPPPPEPEEDECDPRSDRRRLMATVDPVIVRVPGGTVTVRAETQGTASNLMATAGWGETKPLERGPDGAWYATFMVPPVLRGVGTVVAEAIIRQGDGCGDTYGPSGFAFTTQFSIIGNSEDPEEQQEDDGLAAGYLSLEQFAEECLGHSVPWYCGLDALTATSYVSDLRLQELLWVQDLGYARWAELVRRIDQALVREGGQPSDLYVPDEPPTYRP